jgi:hypothetical protein
MPARERQAPGTKRVLKISLLNIGYTENRERGRGGGRRLSFKYPAPPRRERKRNGIPKVEKTKRGGNIKGGQRKNKARTCSSGLGGERNRSQRFAAQKREGDDSEEAYIRRTVNNKTKK